MARKNYIYRILARLPKSSDELNRRLRSLEGIGVVQGSIDPGDDSPVPPTPGDGGGPGGLAQILAHPVSARGWPLASLR